MLFAAVQRKTSHTSTGVGHVGIHTACVWRGARRAPIVTERNISEGDLCVCNFPHLTHIFGLGRKMIEERSISRIIPKHTFALAAHTNTHRTRRTQSFHFNLMCCVYDAHTHARTHCHHHHISFSAAAASTAAVNADVSRTASCSHALLVLAVARTRARAQRAY